LYEADLQAGKIDDHDEQHPAVPSKGRAYVGMRSRDSYVGRNGMDEAPGAIRGLYGNLAQPDEADYEDISRRPANTAARGPPAWSMPRSVCARRVVALQCGAFHISTAGRTTQHHADRPPSPARCWLKAMQQDGRFIWGEPTVQGQRTRARFYRYGLLANPRCGYTSPGWMRIVRELGLGRQGNEPVAARAPCVPDQRREGYSNRLENLGPPPTRPSNYEVLDEGIRIVQRSWRSSTGDAASRNPPRGPPRK